MVALFIDTATERGVVALLEPGKPLYQIELPMGLQNSLTLMPSVQQVLQQVGIKVEDLTLLIAGVGPGSYTGIRVGAVVAKSLSFAVNKPLVGVSTLFGLIPEDGTFASLIDAKIGGVYVLFGERKEGIITYFSQPQMGLIEDFVEQLGDVDFLVTPQATRLRQTIQSKGQWIERAPDAVQMGKLAFEKWTEGLFSMDGSLEVLYLRKTQAEIEKENSN